MKLRNPNRNLIVIGLGIFFGLAILGTIWVAAPTSAQRGIATIQPPSTPRIVPILPRPNIPELSDAERARALALATGHPTLQRVLANRKYTVTAVGVWHTHSLQKLGASLVFTLSEPTSLEDDWPQILYDETEKSFPPYQERVQRKDFQRVQMLTVSVDLNRNAVVAISPFEGGMTLAPLKKAP